MYNVPCGGSAVGAVEGLGRERGSQVFSGVKLSPLGGVASIRCFIDEERREGPHQYPAE